MPDRPLHLSELSSDQKKKFREKYDVFFFDRDDTLMAFMKNPIAGVPKDVTTPVRMRNPIPGVPEAITALSNLGKQLHLFTDSTFHTREAIAKVIQDKFPEFKTENVVCSSWLLTKHLKDIGFNKKVYVMGELNGIVKELEDAGFEVENDDVCGHITPDDLLNVKLDPKVGAVVLGTDLDFSYYKMFKAVNYLRNPETHFFASSPTKLFFSDSYTIPGDGAKALLIEAMSNRKATYYCKSTPISAEYIHSLGYDMSRCLFVGDGLENDVACGNLCGMDTLLVLSGTSTLEDVELARERGDHHLIPTYVGGSVADLGDIFSKD